MKIQFPRLSFVEDAKASIRSIVTVMNDILSQLQGRLDRTPLAEVVPADVVTADAAFIVKHNLGTTPSFATGTGKAAGDLYYTTDDEREWNSKTIKVRHSSTGRLRILVIA